MRFMFLDFACFKVENATYSHTHHTYVLPKLQTSNEGIFQFGKCIFAD